MGRTLLIINDSTDLPREADSGFFGLYPALTDIVDPEQQARVEVGLRGWVMRDLMPGLGPTDTGGSPTVTGPRLLNLTLPEFPADESGTVRRTGAPAAFASGLKSIA
jgi:hypothetical protein